MLDELQTEIRALPGRLDEFLDSPRVPWGRRGRFRPMIVRELGESPNVGILMVASIFRDWMPWIYELGLELYRLTRQQADPDEVKDLAREFRRSVEFAVHGPFSRDFIRGSKEMFMLMEEIEPLLDHSLSVLDLESKHPKRKSQRDTPGS